VPLPKPMLMPMLMPIPIPPPQATTGLSPPELPASASGAGGLVGKAAPRAVPTAQSRSERAATQAPFPRDPTVHAKLFAASLLLPLPLLLALLLLLLALLLAPVLVLVLVLVLLLLVLLYRGKNDKPPLWV
jgi:hypothetical protein